MAIYLIFCVIIFIFLHQTNLMRKDVDVVAEMSTNGVVTPLYLKWKDGKIFEIDKVLDIRKKASLKGGGMGLRYTCQIKNRERYIWLDGYVWFVEI